MYKLPDNYVTKQTGCPHTYCQRSLYTDGKWHWVCSSCGAVGTDTRNLSRTLDTVGQET